MCKLEYGQLLSPFHIWWPLQITYRLFCIFKVFVRCNILRQSANILEISSKTKLYSDYFLPSSIKLWNRLSIDTRNSRSLNIFKERIKTQNSKCPAHYYSGTRLGQILHTRLRMNSSSLNEHLFIRNLVDSPNCACGQVESTSHFLISCKKYTDLRNELM